MFNIFGAPLREAVQGDIVILEDQTVVVVRNQPERSIVFVKDTEDNYYFYRYNVDNTYTIVEEMPVPHG
jgi:hypothetical protein